MRQETSLAAGTGEAASTNHWLKTTTAAVTLTSLIVVIGLGLGHWVTGVLKIGYGWTFVIGVVVIAVEMWLFLKLTRRFAESR